MPKFNHSFSGNIFDRKLTHNELVRAIRFAIAAEYEAIQLYEQLSESIDDKLSKKVLLGVAQEEEVHVGEFLKVLEHLDPDEFENYEKGKSEVEEKFE